MNRTRTVRTLAVLATATMLVAACGDDDDAGSATTAAAGGATTTAGADTTAAGADTTAGSGGGETIRLWLNGTDTPDEVVQYAITEFAKVHPDVTVKLERVVAALDARTASAPMLADLRLPARLAIVPADVPIGSIGAVLARAERLAAR